MPSLTLGTITGSFTRGERIIGSVTGAEGRIIIFQVLWNMFLLSTADFTVNDTITGQSSGATASITACNCW